VNNGIDSLGPDAILITILTGLGMPGFILAAIKLALLARDWREIIDKGLEVTNPLRTKIRGRLPSAIGRRDTPIVILITATVIPAQLILLALWYAIGCYINLLPERDRISEIKTAYQTGGLGPALEQFTAPSPAAIVCLLIGLGALVTAYLQSMAGETPATPAAVVAAPGTAIMWLGFQAAKFVAAIMLFGLALLLLSAFLGVHQNIGLAAVAPIGAVLGAAAIGALYKAACEVGIRASQLVVRTWAPSSEDESFSLSDLLGDWPWTQELARRRRLREERAHLRDY
jgi:hypothetical protein